MKRDKKIIPAATAASGCFRGTSIALLLLKGPSHKAIAAVRQTSEKTVRQQSLAVYRKAGLSGRAELSAFFLEDLLLPVERPVRASGEPQA